ncbi:hypothetical protein JW978_00870 [Candidatus Dojkabacteria bacterium]|nr:hypothetical protein [Candidatus Dojkabacteria bacterium]
MKKVPWIIKTKKTTAAFSLVEVLLAIAMLAIITTAVFGAVFYAQESSVVVTNRNRALYLAEEGLNAAQAIRDDDFANLIDGTYGLSSGSNQWIFNGSSDTVDIFTREIEISTVDATTKQILSRITWTQNAGREGQIELVTYLSDIYISEIIEPLVSWAIPNIALNMDLPGNDNGIKIQIIGNYAYILRGSGNYEFSIYDISNPLAPSLVGNTATTGTPTNFFVVGNYAYVTSTDNTQELQIYDITTPATPTFVSSVNLNGNGNAQSVYVEGTYAYVGRVKNNRDEFEVVNLATIASPTISDTLEIGEGVNSIRKSGNNLFIGTTRSTSELQVVNVTNPADVSVSYIYDLPGNDLVNDLELVDNNLFTATNAGYVYVLDVTNPASFTITGTYDAGGSVTGISVDSINEYLFLASSLHDYEFQVIDISNLSAPALFGSAIYATLNDVAYESVSNKTLGVGDANASELVVFEPQ